VQAICDATGLSWDEVTAALAVLHNKGIATSRFAGVDTDEGDEDGVVVYQFVISEAGG